MSFPFELSEDELAQNLEEMVDSTFSSLQSQFLVLPKGRNFVDYSRFNSAYEVLKSCTSSFSDWSADQLWDALRTDFMCFLVIRTILGFTPPEWADIARELGSDLKQDAARSFDLRAKSDGDYLLRIEGRKNSQRSIERLKYLVKAAEEFCVGGARPVSKGAVHRLDKVDTKEGLISLIHISANDVPYSTLLYERFLGRPFASHRDSVSEHVGDVMENAIEKLLIDAGVSFRRSKIAERVPGFAQAPDFYVPSEFDTKAIIEAKVIGDDGTARDKVARILRLCGMSRDRDRKEKGSGFQVIACIDGRGFGIRRQDMRDILEATKGKVFTLSTLDQLIENTELAKLVP